MNEVQFASVCSSMRNALMRASSFEVNNFSMKANLSFARTMLFRVYEFSTRLIHASTSDLSKGGRSGRLRAWTWLVWLARAAATAASVAIRDCLSLSSLSCSRAILTAFWQILSMSEGSNAMAVGREVGSAAKKALLPAAVGVGDGAGDRLPDNSRMRACGDLVLGARIPLGPTEG